MTEVYMLEKLYMDIRWYELLDLQTELLIARLAFMRLFNRVWEFMPFPVQERLAWMLCEVDYGG